MDLRTKPWGSGGNPCVIVTLVTLVLWRHVGWLPGLSNWKGELPTSEKTVGGAGLGEDQEEFNSGHI